jgi:ATP-binding cassette subfamily C (CFTR/MRP) protein 1
MMIFSAQCAIQGVFDAAGQFEETETVLLSYERCLYFDRIQPEDGHLNFYRDLGNLDKIINDDSWLGNDRETDGKFGIPEGKVEFRDVVARYNKNDRVVIDGLTCEIKPNEKIGIIGRAGAGKSTIVQLLWQYLRPESGQVRIDGQDIFLADVKQLRSSLLVISQDIALFEGNLRENIDPLKYLENDQIEKILSNLGFDGNRSYQEKKLRMSIESEGSNLSEGEKKIIGFCRCLVNKKKLIILDEATSAVDKETEKKIQALIKNEFGDTTMIIVAHRLDTIMGCDRIMVLDTGRVAEFGTIDDLMKIENGKFKSYLEAYKLDAGDEEAEDEDWGTVEDSGSSGIGGSTD